LGANYVERVALGIDFTKAKKTGAFYLLQRLFIKARSIEESYYDTPE
jgi:hypothetical protein